MPEDPTRAVEAKGLEHTTSAQLVVETPMTTEVKHGDQKVSALGVSPHVTTDAPNVAPASARAENYDQGASADASTKHKLSYWQKRKVNAKAKKSKKKQDASGIDPHVASSVNQIAVASGSGQPLDNFPTRSTNNAIANPSNGRPSTKKSSYKSEKGKSSERGPLKVVSLLLTVVHHLLRSRHHAASTKSNHAASDDHQAVRSDMEDGADVGQHPTFLPSRSSSTCALPSASLCEKAGLANDDEDAHAAENTIFNAIDLCEPSGTRSSKKGKGQLKDGKISLDHDIKQPSRLLNLPPEIRNRIYELVFPRVLIPIRVEAFWVTVGNNALKRAYRSVGGLKIPLEIVKLFMNRRGEDYDHALIDKNNGAGQPKDLDIDSCERWFMGSLPFTCKRFAIESTPVLYSSVVFYFENLKHLHTFLDTVPPTSLQAVRTVHISIRTYGIPIMTADKKFETKHIESWTFVLHKVATKMTGITSLHVSIHMSNMTHHLSRAFRTHAPTQPWTERAGPLLIIQPLTRLTVRNNIRFRLHLRCRDADEASDVRVTRPALRPLWDFAHLQPTRRQDLLVVTRFRNHMTGMQRSLAMALHQVSHVVDADSAFAEIAGLVTEWDRWATDPVMHSLNNTA